MDEVIVGIDLGTTNSEISILENGKAKVIPIGEDLMLPSCVGIDPSGKLLVGKVARNQLVSSPESTILSIKRKMGEAVKVPLGDREFTPEEISSFILIELKKHAESYLQRKISKAVITVPAYFDNLQRKATQNAGALAGLEVVRIIHEPTAAAIAYDAGQEKKNQKVLVYDLGGGTFDASLVVVENGLVEVKASHGDTHLGGDDFDQLLIDHALEYFQTKHQVDLKNDLRVQRRLKVTLEKAKWHLSDHPFVQVQEEYLYQEHHLSMEIERSRYQEMIEPLVQKTLDCVSRCLKDANLLPKDLDKVILVGGATRTPYVQEILEETLGVTPHFEINPDLIVSMGAAIQGAIIAGHPTHSILVDITPHSFGTSAVGMHLFGYRPGLYVPIIKRNTPIPVSKSEAFQTLHDNQKKVKVDIYQGEEPLAEDNLFIGDFHVENLSKVPSGNEIVLNLELDINGVLLVTATEKRTGLSKAVSMDTKNIKPHLNLEEAKKNIASLTSLSDREEESSELEAFQHFKKLLKRVEKLKTSITPEDAGELDTLVLHSQKAIQDEAWDDLIGLNEELENMIFYLED
jgi:molecular chaperone DnaK